MFRISVCLLLYLGLTLSIISTLEGNKPGPSLDDGLFGVYGDKLRFEPGFKLSHAELESLVQDYFRTNWGRDMKTNLKSFSWNDCGGTAGKVFNLTVSPDPLHAGNITVAVNATVLKELNSPLKTVLTIEIHGLIAWIKIPCIDDIGSCIYDDICETLESVKCPPVLKNVTTCHCPFPAQNYILSPSKFSLPQGPPKGEYRVKAEIYDASGNRVACLNISELDFH